MFCLPFSFLGCIIIGNNYIRGDGLMELTPEERRKIYEEEKAKIEAGQQPAQGNKPPDSSDTTVGMTPNAAGLLCYLGFWISGIILYVLEQKNNFVRFHAAQSIVTFGALFAGSILLGWIPFFGIIFSIVIGITGFVLWIVLMIKAYNGERYKLPWAGNIAERMAASSGITSSAAAPVVRMETPSLPPPKSGAPAAALVEPIGTVEPSPAKPIRNTRPGHAGRITGSVFAIAWSIALLVFFNLFYRYVAYYSVDTVGRDIIWYRSPLFTSDIHLWLPILNITLALTIVGHVILIIYDWRLLRKIVLIINDALGLATLVTLLSIYPFDFTVIPDHSAKVGTQIGVTAVLVLIAVIFGISALVRLITLLVDIGRGKTRL
jgi:uncharacterized membrane protein